MTQRPLEGAVAVVTGAAGGIGAASAARLSRDGASVVVVDLDGAAAEAVANGLAGPALAVAADVSSEADVQACTRAAVERFGRVDLHHLNAGVPGSAAPLVDVEVAEFDRVIGVNVRGVFLGMREAFRQYRAQSTGGAIAVTASIAGLRGSSDLFAYHTSKHAVVGLVRNAAVYGGPLGIRVNAVAPGIVPTPLFGGASGPGSGGDMARRASTTPLRRAGTPDEIAGVVAFLLGPDSSYLTGETVSVDGGATAVNTVRPSGGAGAWETAELDARTAFR